MCAVLDLFHFDGVGGNKQRLAIVKPGNIRYPPRWQDICASEVYDNLWLCVTLLVVIHFGCAIGLFRDFCNIIVRFSKQSNAEELQRRGISALLSMDWVSSALNGSGLVHSLSAFGANPLGVNEWGVTVGNRDGPKKKRDFRMGTNFKTWSAVGARLLHTAAVGSLPKGVVSYSRRNFMLAFISSLVHYFQAIFDLVDGQVQSR
jgi:hypothetical protein